MDEARKEEEKITGWPSATSCQIANLLATEGTLLLLLAIIQQKQMTGVTQNFFLFCSYLESILSEIFNLYLWIYDDYLLSIQG